MGIDDASGWRGTGLMCRTSGRSLDQVRSAVCAALLVIREVIDPLEFDLYLADFVPVIFESSCSRRSVADSGHFSHGNSVLSLACFGSVTPIASRRSAKGIAQP